MRREGKREREGEAQIAIDASQDEKKKLTSTLSSISHKNLFFRTGAVSSPDTTHSHSAPVRTLAFDASSSRVLSGGDDKAVKVFEKSSESERGGAAAAAAAAVWRPVARWAAAKKVSAACFAGRASPHLAIAADKFGDVVCGPATAEEACEAARRPARPLWRGAPEIFVAKKLAPDRARGRTTGNGRGGEGGAGAGGGGGRGEGETTAAADAAREEQEEPAAPPPLPLFGHFCTVVTALSLSADSTALASCDRDGKVRVTRLPHGGAGGGSGGGGGGLTARGGAPETLAFCLGHTAFCTGVAFLEDGEEKKNADAFSSSSSSPPPSSSYLVASSSGDGSVRLWECFADARGGVPLAALPCSDAAAEASRRRGEACKKVAEVVAARRAAKARVTAALPFGGGGEKRAKKEEGAGEEKEENGEAGGGSGGGGGGGGNDIASDGDEEAEGEEEDDFAGLDLPSSLTAPPAVVCLAGDRCRTLVAAVEGEPELLVIEVGAAEAEKRNDGETSTAATAPSSSSSALSLRISARVAVPGVARPTSLALDAQHRLVWAAGVDGDTGKLVVGFAKLPDAPAAAGGGGGGGDCGEDAFLPSAEALCALCDAADAGAVSPPPPQISQDLRRSLVSPRVVKKGSK